MTTLAETGRQTGWRGRLVWIALALSLTLNVFFIGGLFWVKTFMHPPPPPLERMQRLGETLNLSPDQHHAFEQFVGTIRQHAHAVRTSNRPLVLRIWAELAKPKPDETEVAKLGEQVNTNRLAFQRDVSGAMLTFIKTLSPEQRAHLAQIASTARDESTRRLFLLVAP
jgi:uncharacterized membrane protein